MSQCGRLSLRAVLALAAGLLLAPPRALADGDPALSLSDAEIVERLKSGEVARATALAEAALAHDEKDLQRSPGEVAARLERLAVRFYEAGSAASLEQSERFYARALTLREAESGREPAALAKLLHDVSGLYFNRGDYEKAESMEQRALTIRERIYPPADPKTAESRRDLGLVFLAQGRLAEAAANLVPAIAAIEASSETDWLNLAVGRNYLAELARLQGDHARAASILEQLVQQAAGKLGETNAQFPYFLNNLAGIYRDQERYDEAETLLRRSLTLRKGADPPDAYAVARASLNLAELYREQGKLAEAEPLYVEALAAARAALGAGNPELFEFLNQFAVLRRDQGALAQAEPLFLEALGLAEKGFGPESLRVAQGQLDLASLLRGMGRCRQAGLHDERALAIRERVLGPLHPDVAEALTARAQCLAATAAGGPAARAALDRALGILAGSEAHPASEIDALAARAALRRPRERAQAVEDLAAAIRVVERMRPHRGGGERARTAFFGRHAGIYERMIQWEIEDGHPDRALATSERARARVLLDQLAAAPLGEEEAADPGLVNRLTEVRSELAEIHERILYQESRTDLPAQERAKRILELERRLTDAERRFRQIHDEAKNANPAWRSAIGAEPPSLAEIQAAIVPRGGWLLLYAIGADESFAFAVPDAGSLQVRRLTISAPDAATLGVPAGSLTAGVLGRILAPRHKGAIGPASQGLLARLAAPQGLLTRGIGGLSSGAGPDDRALHALWHALVPPGLWKALGRSAQVLVIPDGDLIALPFEALVLAPGRDPVSTRYWLDAGPVIRYAPSVTFLQQLQRRETSRPDRAAGVGIRPVILSVSDPAYARPGSASVASAPGPATRGGGGALPRLPGTARESEAIQRAFEGFADVVVLSGEHAREQALRNQIGGKRYVHIATHGLVDQKGDELFAALALAPPPPGDPHGEDDGLLQLFEIYALRMDCDLAVLSACGSNAGRLVAGEGVFALSRGFLLGGARRVIATQWSVEDDSTAALVGDLFRRLSDSVKAGRDADIATALRDAKRQIRRKASWAKPFYWAPFVMTGL